MVEVSRDTVTLSRADLGGKLSATLNGEVVERGRALRLLQNADTTVTAEVLPVTIGAARAARLHRILGRVGLCNSDHYGNACRALGREVFSLATLTEAEARTFWRYLQRMFPAVQHAA